MKNFSLAIVLLSTFFINNVIADDISQFINPIDQNGNILTVQLRTTGVGVGSFRGVCLSTGDSCQISLRSRSNQRCSFECPELSGVAYTCSVTRRSAEVELEIGGHTVARPEAPSLIHADFLTADTTDVACIRND